MYEIPIIILSFIPSIILARLTKEEISQGKTYLKLLCNIILAVFVFVLIYSNFEPKIFFSIALGLILGFFIFNPYLYLGLIAILTYSVFSRELFTILTSLFTLSYISLYHKEITWKLIVFCIILFLIPYIFLALPLNMPWLIPGIAIGGIFHVVRENYTGN